MSEEGFCTEVGPEGMDPYLVMKDVEELDKSFSRKSSAKPSKGDSSTAGADSSNKFNRFTQKTYDFSELEKKLVKN